MSATGERRFGCFRVESDAGQSGSQGAVYRAVCERPFPGVAVGETVALKVMPSSEDPDAQDRFERSVDAIAGIRNGHVVRYLGCFREAGPFQSQNVTVMEWLDGETLKERLGRETGGMDADEALKIADGILAGLAAAQTAGLVHRDIKPGNVFLCRNGSVKLIDFDIAHRLTSTSKSSSGGFAGSFDYMAPEFVDPSFRGTFASDVFAVGVVLHEALTGHLPYVRKTEDGEQADFAFLSRWTLRKEGLCAIRIRPCVRRVLSHADEVLAKALAEDPAARYPDADAFRSALRTIRYREVRSATDAYRLLRVVGEGGFGCVYRARARGAGRFVAVKQLKRPEFGDRFRREANVMRRLDDPAFVRLVDYFETRDVGATGAFLVMDFLPGMPGSSLRDAILRAEESPLPFADVIRAFECYARALSIMHRLRIYHRDIKPSNLYYPHGEPEKSAIMDLGIARDVSGTATQGQVPGTLDYMPPEVVLGGSRGDAGMDIYALGLCLYEAATGKKGYPRLPTGSQAFSAFYERARSRRPPVFDAPCIRNRPQLLALLRDMTALDPSERLQDAEQLRRRLVLVGKEVPGEMSTAVALRPVTEVMTQDAPTGATAGGTGMSCPTKLPVRRPSGFSPSPAVRKAGLVSAGAVLVLLAGLKWGPGGIAELRAWSSRRAVEKIEEDRAVVAERERTQAWNEAAVVLAGFRTNATVVAADAEASRWLLKWRGNVNVAKDYPRKEAEFNQAREDRRQRDVAAEKEKRHRTADGERQSILADIRGTNVAAEVCGRRIDEWAQKWQGEIDTEFYKRTRGEFSAELTKRKDRDALDMRKRWEEEQKRIRLARKAKEAAEKAGPVAEAYADMSQSFDVADLAYGNWRENYREVLGMPSVSNANGRISAARKRRAGWEGGERVVAECNRYLDNIPLVGVDEVRNWRGLVRQAELAIGKAEGVGGVSPKQAEAVRARIAKCGKWIVGVIDNKTDRVIDFVGQTVGPVSALTVVFTNGYPVGAAVRCSGCDPIHVREERFSATVFTVMPRDIEDRVCETKANLPTYPAGILCLIDGIERKAGEVLLRRGQHTVRYFRSEQTYPGVRDYEPKEYLFETRLSGAVEVPEPKGEWHLSSEFRRAKENAGLLARGKAIVADCRRLLEPQPVEGRRARLEKAHAILSDWKTSSALGVLGIGVEKGLKAEYETERARVRGYVKNSTALAASVVTDVDPVAVPAGAKVLVTFEHRWPNDARAVIEGYEFVMLPVEASAFDGKTFEIRPEKLVPLPVRVKVPAAEEGVTCLVDGKKATEEVVLRPGTHVVAWQKPDHVEQKSEFQVKVSTPMSLPAPAKWEPNGAFSGFMKALRAFNSGTVDTAKKLSDDIGDIEDPARRKELEDLKRAIDLRLRLQEEAK